MAFAPLARWLGLSLLLVGCAPAGAPGPASPPPPAPGEGCQAARSPAPLTLAAAPDEAAGALPALAAPPLAVLAAPPPWTPLPRSTPLSTRLRSGLFNPMPGGLLSGYSADTGLDVSGFRMPVYAVAPGTLDYAEAGHTRWTSKGDSPFTIRLRLDEPIPWKKGRQITHAYYGHLSSLEVQAHEGQLPRGHVEGGQRLGISGWANGSPHLHLGLLLDGHVDQESWDFILDEAEVREALGAGSNGRRLPR